MKFHPIVYSILFVVLFCIASAAQTFDSLLINRQKGYNNYTSFKNNMLDRSWINLVNLTAMADELIHTDNEIIDKYQRNEIIYNRQLLDSLENVKLSLSLYKKEAEIAVAQLNEQKSMVNILLIVGAVISILFLVAVSFLFGSHARNKAARKEIDRLWRKQDEPDPNIELSIDKIPLAQEISKLTEENILLKKRMESIDKLKLNAEAKLKEEISSRHEAENEIRNLIEQIKK
ncbi:MAG: hypothetical protein R2750_04440 [Bacteroidales bacterium]